jgi:hypothetical protein
MKTKKEAKAKLDLMNIKTFAFQMIHQKLKRQAIKWQKTLANHMCDKLLSRITKNIPT